MNKIKKNLLTKIDALYLVIQMLQKRLIEIEAKLYSRDLFENGSYNLDKKHEETTDLLKSKIDKMNKLFNEVCKLN